MKKFKAKINAVALAPDFHFFTAAEVIGKSCNGKYITKDDLMMQVRAYQSRNCLLDGKKILLDCRLNVEAIRQKVISLIDIYSSKVAK